MRVAISALLRVSIVVSLVAFAAWTVLFVVYGLSTGWKLDVKTFPTFLDGYKAIGIGFLVAVLVVLVPQLLPEEKYRFERLKDSREAYSKAQTGITYLPNKIAALSLVDSVALLQSVHQDLHVAQTYEELASHLAPYDTPEEWGPSKYGTLMAIKTTLEERMEDWDTMPPVERLANLKKTIKASKATR
jgi:hypothetical protein